mmetsp:Transcript_62119/g.134872  ORF Transcript_62119/g.134872 Transcript_62119/m.134872 type:complete len:215 (+) Transcript_62119:149-793(+)
MTKHHEHSIGYCLYCVPLKFSVIFYSALIIALSAAAVLSLCTEDYRLLVGGFCYTSRGIVTLVGFMGLFFGLASLVSVFDNTSNWVRTFTRFALLRCVSIVFIFSLDHFVLQDCEQYSHTGTRFSSATGSYNAALATVALQDRCAETKSMYLLYTTINLIFSLFGAYTTSRWCHAIDQSPSYQISLNETTRLHRGFSDMGHPVQERATDNAATA